MTTINIPVEYLIGDTIFLKTDPDQKPRIVVSYTIYGNADILYKVNCGTEEYYALPIEISKDRNVLMLS